jgi:hypothetical protein
MTRWHGAISSRTALPSSDGPYMLRMHQALVRPCNIDKAWKQCQHELAKCSISISIMYMCNTYSIPMAVSAHLAEPLCCACLDALEHCQTDDIVEERRLRALQLQAPQRGEHEAARRGGPLIASSPCTWCKEHQRGMRFRNAEPSASMVRQHG